MEDLKNIISFGVQNGKPKARNRYYKTLRKVTKDAR